MLTDSARPTAMLMGQPMNAVTAMPIPVMLMGNSRLPSRW